MEVQPKYRVDIASPPDRERLVAEVFVGDAQWVEVLCEDGRHVEVEYYSKPDGSPWRLPFEASQAALSEAVARLMEKQ
jgi:hypothetical protein